MRPLIARLIANRGVPEEKAAAWIAPSLRSLPDPRGLTDMDAAADRLIAAIDSGESVVVHGDYDVDGCTSTAVLVHLLRRLGGNVDWYAPHRIRDGYGIQAATMRRLAEQGAKVVITCDNGTSANEAIAVGNEHGIDTVVVDHHRLPDVLPEAHAILNPKRDGAGNPFEDLAAVGVSFMLAIALRSKLRDRGDFADREEPDLRDYLPTVALGTVADLAPLHGVNRILVSAGLRLMSKARHPGLSALREVARLSPEEPIKASHLGFQLGPRINAAGRLDEAARAVELLLTEDEGAAQELAQLLDQTNTRRRELEQRVYEDSLRQAEELDLDGPGGLVLWSEDWHPGVIGIVASKVMRHFWRPTLLLSVRDGVAVGSGRAIPGIDLFAVLREHQEVFERYGGHRAAAGVTVKLERLEELRELFASQAFAHVEGAHWEPSVLADAEVRVHEVDWDLFHTLRRLAPFGLGNAEPCFLARGLHAIGAKELSGGRGLRMRLRGDRGAAITAVGWDLGLGLADLDGPVDALFTVQENVWRGRSSLELRLRELRRAE
ncbi:MAG: single-stranded-DNA-specific exonuclease RecJ [Deltaproteobacteria bacterium]|nr:single-stranded-DNA-specific exonuclease RecJ [Deltaproteobacteria bacterium]